MTTVKIKFLIALCSALFLASPALAQNKVYLYTWDNYIAPEVFKAFEKETGIQVVADVFSNGDALIAKLKAGGGYDVVTPSGNYIPQMAAEGLLKPLPESIKQLGATLAKNVQTPEYDRGYAHAMPLFYGTTSIAVNTKTMGEEITSWQQFFNRPAGEKPTLGMLDEVVDVMALASMTLGIPLCDDKSESYKAIQALLMKQKPFVKVYGATGYTERMAAGETAMQMAWNGDVYRARRQNPALKYIYPKEGIELWVDNLAIPATSKNTGAAEKFIAFVLRPDNMAAYSRASGMMPAVAAAREKLPKDMRDAPELNIPPGIRVEVSRACPAAVVKAHAKIWSELMR